MKKYDCCLDYDSVLHEFKDGWTGDIPEGEPVPDAKWAMDLLIKNGKTIIIQTTRTNKTEVIKWLKKHNFPDIEVVNRKPIARFYIDDRAIRFEGNWQDTIKYIL